MKKMLGVVVVVPLLFGGLAACGGSDSGSSTTETTAAATPAETMAEETTEPTTEATTGDSGSAVDAYCQKVDEYAADAPAHGADTGAAGGEGRVPVGEAVDGPVQGNTGGQSSGQSRWQRPLDEIAQHAADAVGFNIACEKRVGQKVHAKVPAVARPTSKYRADPAGLLRRRYACR